MKTLILFMTAISFSLLANAQELPQPPGPGKTDAGVYQQNSSDPYRTEIAKTAQEEFLKQLKEKSPQLSTYKIFEALFLEANEPVRLFDFQSYDNARQNGLYHHCVAVDQRKPEKVYEVVALKMLAVVQGARGAEMPILNERVAIYSKGNRTNGWKLSSGEISNLKYRHFAGSTLTSTKTEIVTVQDNSRMRRVFRKKNGMILGKQTVKVGSSYFYCQIR